MLERLGEIESPLIRKIIGYPLLALMWIVFGLVIAIIAAVTFYAIQALMPFIASFVTGLIEFISGFINFFRGYA